MLIFVNCVTGLQGNHTPIFEVSGKIGTNIKSLILFMRQMYDDNEEPLSLEE